MTETKGVKSVRFDDELWQEMRLYCVKNRQTVSQYLQNLVRNDLKSKKK